MQGGRRIVPFENKLGNGSVSVELVSGTATTGPTAISELSSSDTKALLARLEPLPDLSAQNAKAPTMRAPSPPPPRSGTPAPISFAMSVGKPSGDFTGSPLANKPAPPPLAPLDKPQISPVGDVNKETEIRVRFSDAMVPVAAVGQNEKAGPIATITPRVEGVWRWIDTRVATFTAKAAYFPNATEYTVTVPAGTKSLEGRVLGEPVEQKFRTRPLTLKGTWPSSVLRPDSALVVQFDQAFDPKAVAKFLRVVHAKRAVPWKTITLDEAKQLWALNGAINYKTDELPNLLGEHYMIIAPAGKWPAGTEPQVALGVNAPSKEGPLLSTRESFEGFRVAAPFRVLGITCDWHDDTASKPVMTGRVCPMFSHASVEFTNPIEERTYRSSKVQLEGEEFEDHSHWGNSVSLWVPQGVGRTLNVAIAGDLADVYGQPIVGPRRPSFTVGKQRFESFVYSPNGLQILDPRWEIPQWVVEGQEVDAFHVQIFSVKPADYLAYEAFERKERATPPGKKVFDKLYPVGLRHGGSLHTDLRPFLSANGTGHVVVVVQAQPTSPQHTQWTPKQTAWLQVTKLGTTSRVDGEHINAFVQDISPSNFTKPIAGAKVTLSVEGQPETPSATSDTNGHVQIDLMPAVKWTNTRRTPTTMISVETADDSMFTTYLGRSEKAQRHQSARWYVTDDRFMYKPGEKVYLKGWVRWTHDGVNPDLAFPSPGDTVAWTLTDSRGNKMGSGSTAFTDQGGFDLETELPANANQGNATFTFTTKNQSVRHPIDIQEFRRPAYAVSLNEDVTHAGATPLVLGEAIEMLATAKYYAGGGLPGAKIDWRAKLAPATYRPPGWDHFTFWPRLPAWTESRLEAHDVVVDREHSLSGDSSSTAVFGITSMPVGQPSLLEVDATVTDVDRMTIRASSRQILVHPSTLYVGARLQPNTTDILELIVTDIDGNLVPNVAIDVRIEGVLWSERNRDDAKVGDKQSCKVKSDTKAVTCRVARKGIDWVYTTLSTVEDSRGRSNFTTYTLPWYGYDREADPAIVPDKKSYRVGDTAKLEIKSKVVPGVAMVTFARQGVISQKRVELATASTFIDVPIEPGWLQNVHVLVDRLGDRRYKHSGSKRTKLPLPEVMSAEIDLPVEVESARLSMRTRSMKPLVEPGESATFEVEVKHEGKPKANAEVALIVVDEAVLALSGKSHADPLQPFYRVVGQGTQRFDSMMHVGDDGDELDKPVGFERWKLDPVLHGTGAGGGGSGMGTIGTGRYGTIGHGSGSSSIVVSRKDFRATAAFSPRLKTDEDGRVKLTVTMPDSLTRFRIVALATADARWFGKAESAIVTQRKVNARTVAPRFLTMGDTVSVPVVVQNLDTTARTIDVAARAANLVAKGPAGQRVVLQGGQRAEVRFDFATQDRGKAVVQTIAVSGTFADASNTDIPVYEPATTESFATYGVVDDAPKFERLEVPADIFTDVGGVEVELASTQMQSLTDAYWYLFAYPYECNEQRSSRMIVTTAMADVIDAFAMPGRPTKHEIAAQAALDVKELIKDQNRDGGWGYFDGMRSDPYVTQQVLVALAAHRDKGAGPAIAKATTHVRAQVNDILNKLAAAAAKPAIDRKDRATYPAQVSLAAAITSALATTKVDMKPQAERLHALATKLGAYPIDAKARLLAIVAKVGPKPMRDKLLADLLSATHETAAAASVATSYEESERALLPSNTKTTALALDAIMREDPKQAIAQKLARGVLDSRKRGRWVSTQENLVVLQTMRRFFDTYEKDTPNYTGKLWFGAAAYAEQTFAGRNNLRGLAQVDWDRLPARSGHDLALQKTGPGRMYYRIGITYAPKRVDLPALDAGFLVRRSYEAIDSPDDVTKLSDGSIRVKLGARVRVRLEAINSTERYAVALVDPLPAGFEAVNEALVTSERVAAAQDDAHWDFTAHRDTRVEAFRMNLAAGKHRYTYTARATTPGTFIAAPTKAEEMYSPETFGRGTGTSVVIE